MPENSTKTSDNNHYCALQNTLEQIYAILQPIMQITEQVKPNTVEGRVYMELNDISRFLSTLFFIGIYILTSLFTSFTSGWSDLGKYYYSQSKFTGKKLYFRLGKIGGTSYNNLIVGSNDYGLYLAVPLLWRIGHPPLLIPWSDISVIESKWLFTHCLEFTFVKVSSAKLQIADNIGKMLISNRPDSF